MRHSDLKNNLHFSRLKVFSGDISQVVPDFVDQVLTDSVTNRVYRATGTTAGQLVELVPQVEQRVIFEETFPAPSGQQLLVRLDQNRIYRSNGILPTDWLEIVGADGGGSGGGGSSAISVGINPPQNAPDLLGQQYFDSKSKALYVAISDGGALVWRNTKPPVSLYSDRLNSDISYIGDGSAYGDFTWVYADLFLDSPQQVNFDWLGFIDVGSNLPEAIATHGAGCYGLSFNLNDPNSQISYWEITANLQFFVKGQEEAYSVDGSCFATNALINGINSSAYFLSPDRSVKVELLPSAYISAS